MYQKQLLQLIEERAALERAIGENKARVDQALLLIAALEQAAPTTKPRLVATSEYAPLQDAVYEVVSADIVGPKGLEFYDIMQSLRHKGIEANTATVRATLAKLIDKRKIRRVSRGAYGPLVKTA